MYEQRADALWQRHRTARAVQRRPLGITLSDKRNAGDQAIFDALTNVLYRARDDARGHCLLLHGVGRHFGAGHDVAEFATAWPQAEDGAVRRCFAAFAEQSEPIVAAVTGVAVGFGATMLLHADRVAAGESEMFEPAFADLAVVPEASATTLLARRVGDRVARDLAFPGSVDSSLMRAVPEAMRRCLPGKSPEEFGKRTGSAKLTRTGSASRRCAGFSASRLVATARDCVTLCATAPERTPDCFASSASTHREARHPKHPSCRSRSARSRTDV